MNKQAEWIIKLSSLRLDSVKETKREIPSANTGWRQNGLRAALRRGNLETSGIWLRRRSTSDSNVYLQPRKTNISWDASKVAWPAGQGKGFCGFLLHSWDPTSLLLWGPQYKTDVGVTLEESDEAPLQWGQTERAGVIQHGEAKALVETL